jgi:protein gp37
VKVRNPIGWCDETGNVVTGCDKVSPGCKNCYAESSTIARVLRHGGIETWGPAGVRHPVKGFEDKAARLNKGQVCDSCAEFHYGHTKRFCDVQKGSARCGGRLRTPRFFADSTSDWLDPRWSDGNVLRMAEAILHFPHVDFLLLTKRPERFKEQLERALEAADARKGDEVPLMEGEVYDLVTDWIEGLAPGNVWLGFSAEGQREFEERRRHHLPAAVNFASCEPLLEPIELELGSSSHSDAIDWFIVGGESGPNRRDCGAEAIHSIADQCAEAGVPVYVKQDCAEKPGQQGRIRSHHWRRKEFPR